MAEGGVVRQLNTMEMPDVPSTPDESVHLRERGRNLPAVGKHPHDGKSQGLRARFDEALGVLAGLHARPARASLRHAVGRLEVALRSSPLVCGRHHRAATAMKKLQKLPQVRQGELSGMPRSWVLMRGFLEETEFVVTEKKLVAYVDGAVDFDPLEFKELWALGQMLKLNLFEEAAKRGRKAFHALGQADGEPVSVHMDRLIQSLRLVGEMDWEEMVEPLSPVNRIFMEDPAGVFL